MEDFLNAQPKQMRKIWGNVTGERLWYALHGYDVKAEKSKRGMFGHGRVLPPKLRNFTDARDCSRILIVKAARRMRREGFYASTLYLWLSLRYNSQKETSWASKHKLHMANDDQACLSALDILWTGAKARLPKAVCIVRLGVTLGDLSPATFRQLDMLINDDPERQKWGALTTAMDSLNSRYGKSLVTMGLWKLPPGGNLGGKISFTRIPRAEDFW